MSKHDLAKDHLGELVRGGLLILLQLPLSIIGGGSRGIVVVVIVVVSDSHGVAATAIVAAPDPVLLGHFLAKVLLRNLNKSFQAHFSDP